MIRKAIFNLNAEFKTIAGSALVISGATLLSRIVGLLRDRVLANQFGAGNILDAYYAAFKIPDLIYNLLVVGALSAGFIPVFTKLFFQKDDGGKEAWDLTNNIINIMAILMLALGIIGVVFTPFLAPLIAPGFTLENREITVSLMRIMFFSPLLFGVSMIFGGVLQSLRRFFLFSVAPLFYNLGIILGAIYLTKYFGINGLALGVVLGAFLHMIIQYYGAYQAGFRFKKIFNPKDKETITIGKLMIPRTAGLAIAQIDLLVITFLASFLPVGSLAIYTLANNLQAVPIGLIGIPFALAVFPVLSKLAAQDNMDGFTKQYLSSAKQIIFLVFPLVIIYLTLNLQIVRLVLGSGSFTWQNTLLTSKTLAYFSLGMLAQSLTPLLARAFYSLSNTKTPFYVALVAEIVTITSAIFLMHRYGVYGLAGATAIGSTLNVLLLFIFLHKKLKIFNFNDLLMFFFKIILAGTASFLTIYYFVGIFEKLFNQTKFYGVFLQAFLSAFAGLIFYLIMCYLLRLPEVFYLFSSLKKQWFKLRNLPNEEIIKLNE